MQNVKQTKSKLISGYYFALLAMMLLSSCSKNTAEIPGRDNLESTVANNSNSSPSEPHNGLVLVPFEETLFVPCANGGAGENIVLTGTTSFVYQIIWTDHGFNLSYHANNQGVTGVGASSGNTFVASGGIQGTVAASWVNNQWIGTTIEQLRIIGKNSSFIVNNKYHITVTPDGNIAVNAKEKTVDCRN